MSETTIGCFADQSATSQSILTNATLVGQAREQHGDLSRSSAWQADADRRPRGEDAARHWDRQGHGREHLLPCGALPGATPGARERRPCKGTGLSPSRFFPVVLDTVLNEDETGYMEAVGIAVVVFGPLVAFLLLIIKATRNLMPQRQALPPFRSQDDAPPGPGDLSSDREPRRPLMPSRSGAVAVAPPVRDDDEPHEVAIRQVESPSDAASDQRLAG